jgi:hypothetical protein
MGDVPEVTGFIWKYPTSAMFPSCVSYLKSTIIAEAKIESWEEASQGFCWLEWFNFDVVQSTLGMLIYPWFCLLAKWLGLLKVVCRAKWMPWIALFCKLLMLFVQTSYFTICFSPRIFHSNYLHMSLGHCWIRGTGEIRLHGVGKSFGASITEIIYLCYHCVTVAYCRSLLSTMYFGD